MVLTELYWQLIFDSETFFSECCVFPQTNGMNTGS